MGEREDLVTQRENAKADRDPQETVVQVLARHRDHECVLFGDGPVLGERRKRLSSEGVDEARHELVFHVRDELSRDQVPNEKDGSADVVGEHAPRDECEPKEERAGEEHVGQDQIDERV